jgi:hypothetical protein
MTVFDLAGSSLADYLLESVMFGGGPAHDTLVSRTRKAIPVAVV